MARITVEDCIDKCESRFELVLVASNRARKLHAGEIPTVEKDNDKNTVIALREIADETITSDEFKNSLIEEYQTISPVDEEELAIDSADEHSNNQTEESLTEKGSGDILDNDNKNSYDYTAEQNNEEKNQENNFETASEFDTEEKLTIETETDISNEGDNKEAL